MVLMDGKRLEKGGRQESNIPPLVEAMLMLFRADLAHLDLSSLDGSTAIWSTTNGPWGSNQQIDHDRLFMVRTIGVSNIGHAYGKLRMDEYPT